MPHKRHLFNSLREHIIARHWEDNFPKEAAELKRLGLFYSHVEEAAEMASLVEEQARLKGLGLDQAQELSLEMWGQCPDLRENPRHAPPRPTLVHSSATTASPTTE